MIELDRYLEWDGAYVLGSLSAADRREYEAHLETCPDCRAAVGELAGLPGLLSRVPVESFADLDPLPIPPMPEHLLEPPAPVVRLADRKPRKYRQFAIGAGAAVLAAAAAVVVTVGVLRTDSVPHHGQTVAERAMDPLSTTPLTADFAVVAEAAQWSRVRIECRYNGTEGNRSYNGMYAMWITLRNGSQEKLGTWAAEPGAVYRGEALANTPADQITSVQIRADDTGTVLLSGNI